MSAPMRFGLVGAGAIAQAHADALRALEGVELVAVADVRTEAANALAEPFAAQAVESHEQLNDVGVDAVIVSTPPNTHAQICSFFLEQGVPVLCEKPLCLDVASAEKLLELAHKKSALFTMASKFRFVDDMKRAKSLLASRVLGDIVLCENAFTSRVDMGGRWNSDPKVSGGGVLIDNGTHSVDIIRYLFGPITEVQALEGKRVQSLDVEDTVRLFARCESGVMASIDLSWSLNKEQEHYVYIYGSTGIVRVGWRESRYRQTSSTDWVTFGQGYNKHQAFLAQLDNFKGAVQGSAKLLITDDDAVASVRVIEAAYKTLKSSNWVKV